MLTALFYTLEIVMPLVGIPGRSAPSGELDSYLTSVFPPLVGCSGVLANHFVRRSSAAFLSGKIT
jgi:hypothetical protein